MSPHEFNFLHVFHVSSVLVLIGLTFYACAGAPDTRRRVTIWAGIASLLVLASGLRMLQAEFNFALAGWVWVKLACWLGISALGGMAYRRRERARLFGLLAVLLAILAVAMAYTKPF
jgi:uncharacterized membrane protein SirB2